MNNIDISIITVCYNSGKTIERLLNSIYNSNYSNKFEHIIIDGMSTDKTGLICNSFAQTISRITYIKEPDHGIYDAMNKGARIAKGRYLLFLNSDDWIYNGTIDKMIEYINDFNFEILISLTDILDYEGKSTLKISKIQINKYGFALPHPSTLILTNYFIKSGGYNQSYNYAADREFFIRSFLKNKVSYNYVPILLSAFNQGGFGSRVGWKGIYENFRIDFLYTNLFYAFFILIKNIMRLTLSKLKSKYYQ